MDQGSLGHRLRQLLPNEQRGQVRPEPRPLGAPPTSQRGGDEGGTLGRQAHRGNGEESSGGRHSICSDIPVERVSVEMPGCVCGNQLRPAAPQDHHLPLIHAAPHRPLCKEKRYNLLL
ncbi:MAG: hypothetical protein MJE68_26625 [Proteobacteria bacterium]|nr:hypothetical protein [Pseudomonadota bacterium]